jgi:hypothetical protein
MESPTHATTFVEVERRSATMSAMSTGDSSLVLVRSIRRTIPGRSSAPEMRVVHGTVEV